MRDKMKSMAEQEVDRLRHYLNLIAELADGMENSLHEAAVAHLAAISRLVKASQ